MRPPEPPLEEELTPAQWIPALVCFGSGAYLVGIGFAYLAEWVRLWFAA